MNMLVVYESMFGNTHAIANAIADGLRAAGEVRVVPVSDATIELLDWADLVVAGGPTHAHGMTRSSTRKGAAEQAAKPDSSVSLEPDAAGVGMREWVRAVGFHEGKLAAAFDTRVSGPALLTGRASGGIANGLKGQGFELTADPESFLVSRHNELVAGELERAQAWGAGLGVQLSAEA
jgi:hypothetical protein